MNEQTRAAIRKTVGDILRGSGNACPPVSVGRLLEFRRVHRRFYDLDNPSFYDELKHKVHVHGRPLLSFIHKIRLVAMSFFDQADIVIDSGLPLIKHDWTTCHELIHQILPWHRVYFMGDTAQTLHPDWQEMLESEANFGAAEMMFCGALFAEEARDTVPCWASVCELQHRYGKSLTATLRRYVDSRPDVPMAMLVSTPRWSVGTEAGSQRCRHCVRSACFEERFGHVSREALLHLVDGVACQRRGGPVADCESVLQDGNGGKSRFRVETFYNRYDLLTLIVEVGRVHCRAAG